MDHDKFEQEILDEARENRDRLTAIEHKFAVFHHNNPQVYALLVRFAREWRARHPRSPCGIKALYERARWEVAMTTQDTTFKLNNNYTACYARLIMEENRDLKGIFNLRKSGSEE